MLRVFTDGAARGNPGPSAIGFAVFDGEKLKETKTRYIGRATNNEAEYRALILALEKVLGEIEVYSDSQLMVKQMRGEFKVKDEIIKLLYEKVRKLVRGRKVSFHLVPRENKGIKMVDRLINKELDKNV
jgi:ribonuclease HI